MNYGMPYMGSKSDVIKSLALNFPSADHFYDLFGGGFAVSDYMSQYRNHKYKHFHYNEIKADVVDLVRRAVAGEFNYSRFQPKWISREEFFAKKEYDAYIRLIWSFGNRGSSYLYGPKIASYKRSLHQAVVFAEFDEVAVKALAINAWPKDLTSIKQRLIYFRQKVRFLDDNQPRRPEHLEGNGQMQHLEGIDRLARLEHLERVDKLDGLHQRRILQHLERTAREARLEGLSPGMTFTSLSYEQVKIEPNAVVYCDIPYLGTQDYGNEFSHQKFYEWAATRPFPVYISEYQLKDPRFKVIYKIDRTIKMSPKGQIKNKEANMEKLFWNGK